MLGLAATVIVASGLSLTNFVRRPELSGEATSVASHYETHAAPSRSPGALGMMFLRFLNHYPSHIFLWAALARLDAFLWMYAALNALYLARGWLGLALRFGRR